MGRSPTSPRLSRRQMFRLASAGVLGGSASGWLQTLAASAATDSKRRKACILLWVSGGPSQIDTFDPKPGHTNGGPFKPIQTSVPGILLGEHLPRLAKNVKDLAIIRGMSTKEGDHSRATYNLRTGYLPQGPVRFPTLGSLVAKELEGPSDELPGFVSISPVRAFSAAAFSPGFLGPKYAPLIVGERAAGAGRRSFRVEDLDLPAGVGRERADDRIALLGPLGSEFLATHPGVTAASHQDAYGRAVKLMRSPAGRAFELEEEPGAMRDAYGRNPFGQGCLLARRLVERGVPFVEVTLSSVDGRNNMLGWDTHAQNFDAVKTLSTVLDAGWATLMTDLQSRGLLESTLIVWMGEFGRTPKINENAGRDHYPNAWSTVLAGGGLKGGQVIGSTGADGMEVRDRKVSVPDLLATVVKGLGLDPTTQNVAENGRPIRVVDSKGTPISEVCG
jgi:hypothetical protein